MIKSDKVRLFILLSYLFIFSWFSYHSIREYINAVSFDWSFTFSSHSLIHGFILLFMYRNILLSQGGGPVHLFEITKWPVLSQYLILHACYLSFKIPPFYLLWCFLLYESCFLCLVFIVSLDPPLHSDLVKYTRILLAVVLCFIESKIVLIFSCFVFVFCFAFSFMFRTLTQF